MGGSHKRDGWGIDFLCIFLPLYSWGWLYVLPAALYVITSVFRKSITHEIIYVFIGIYSVLVFFSLFKTRAGISDLSFFSFPIPWVSAAVSLSIFLIFPGQKTVFLSMWAWLFTTSALVLILNTSGIKSLKKYYPSFIEVKENNTRYSHNKYILLLLVLILSIYYIEVKQGRPIIGTTTIRSHDIKEPFLFNLIKNLLMIFVGLPSLIFIYSAVDSIAKNIRK